MDATTTARLVAVLIAPSAVAGAVLGAVRCARAVGTWRRRRTPAAPAGPPLEQTAVALRRLLAEHERVRRSQDVAVRAARLRSLDGAITDCALDAARALEVAAPAHSGREPLPREALRQLLADLTGAGLLLPGAQHFGR
ncbi:hypothetical protein BH24ACT10_BH24ACT10_17310 [soil metagenome]